jgi:8-oxo-dGTP diphosphatase
MNQISYCFTAWVVGAVVQPSFTESEIEDGFAVEWVNPKDALMLLKSGVPQSYHGRFIQVRDLAFLEKAIEIDFKGRDAGKPLTIS